MSIQPALAQLFAICALSAAVESVAGGEARGVHAVCGLAVALSALRLAMGLFE